MKRILALVLAGAFWMAALHADEQPTQAADAAAPDSAAIDAGAMEALDRMGTYLRSLDTFRLQAEDRIDQVLDSGQKIQLSASIQMQVRRPDGLRAEIETDSRSRRIVYDGKTFTIVAPGMGYYTTVPAPPTIGETLTMIGSAWPFLWSTSFSGVRIPKRSRRSGPPSHLARARSTDS